MKFSHSLQFNAVPEWSSKYIAYTTLKKLIYQLQRDSLRFKGGDLELAHLIENEHALDDSKDPKGVFIAALDAELKKIDTFYRTQETIIFKNVDELVVDIENFENELQTRGSIDDDLRLPRSATQPLPSLQRNPLTTTDGETEGFEDEDEDEDEDDGEISPFNSRQDDALSSVGAPPKAGRRKSAASLSSLSQSRSKVDSMMKSPKTPLTWKNPLPAQLLLLSETRVILRKRIIGLYTTLSELKSFIELNHTGFKKALKKFDKSLNTSIKDDYLNKLPEESYIFKPETIKRVDDNIESLIQVYALICNHSDLEQAKQELSIHLREHVVWERNTVWRDMIGLERKANRVTQSAASDSEKGRTKKVEFKLSLKNNPTLYKLIVITAITLALLHWSPFDDEQQKNCFALLICASLLWATESLPLFVTSLLIPLLILVFQVLKNPDGSPMEAVDASKYILSTMWNSVILLLLGGFTLAAALSKYHIAKLLSTWILSKAGTNPSIVLLTIMGVALFSSMWISNVAAPVLCFSLIQPLLRTLPKTSNFSNALILGIALASNIGGMASPIASPQNMIAIGVMDPAPSWGEWFVIATPVCLLSLLLIWVFLLISFNTNSRNTHLVPIRTIDDKFTGVQWYIVFVSILTIVLWCVASRLEGIFGEMGIIALIPLILFFGPGLLSTEDFNNYPWNIVVLAMGGTALGKAVSSSGLLNTIAISIQKQVQDFSLFGVTLTFGLLILVMATFVSHTVAALIVLPLVSEIGNNLSHPRPRLLVMVSALLCSAAMGLPTSGFPNVNAICMTDEFGKPYLTVSTFITRGVPSSVIAYLMIVTVGFGIMMVIGF
ncbi:low-affinity phosphate transporter [Scheffersomyces spartinae]|uniref:Low-affinity phosphate transporter n=1 Tax=Scheffersomyces spartinae TaxID=45513 RepID=A0A9P7VBA4_9ASCO|nr:low-affinity phosphate transporter [Scheffersomyces spartinae]KAG7194809.1 low-affinity phosphate transporter [Scheffersomyces spartinae]